MERPGGVEPPTYGFVVRRSDPLSYGRVNWSARGDSNPYTPAGDRLSTCCVCQFRHKRMNWYAREESNLHALASTGF